MLVKEFPISGASTDNRFTVPTVYKFLTVFNNSTHELVFTDDTDVNNRYMHFAVSPFQYVTYPLEMMGTVASCKRTQSLVMNSIERIVKRPFFITSPNVRLLFSEENFNVNNYQQAHSQVNVHLPEAVSSSTSPTQEIPFVQPNLITPLPLPVNITNFPIPTILNFTAKHDLIRGLIPRSGTIPINGSITFITHSSHVRRYSILIRSERDCTLIIRERIDTIEGAGVFIQVASVAVPGANAPFTHTGELLGNMLEVVLLNGAVGTSIYDISMLGHVT